MYGPYWNSDSNKNILRQNTLRNMKNKTFQDHWRNLDIDQKFLDVKKLLLNF